MLTPPLVRDCRAHMTRWIALLAVGVCACTLPTPTVGEAREPPQPRSPPAEEIALVPKPSQIAGPCAVESEAYERATREFEAIAQRIEQLGPTDDPEPLWIALQQLVMGECFELRRVFDVDADDEAPSSGLALRTWWADGGAEWIEQFLTPDMTWERPSVRVAFTPELTPDHPLADLSCPLADLDCDPRTRGWTLRAKQAFEQHAERRWTRQRTRNDELPATRDWSQCEQLATTKPDRLGYEIWIECIDHVTLRQSVFPIGGLRAPDTGWFIIRGRRGHYQFCDEIRAFDLATGSVHVAASCSGLALRNDGSVDGAQTSADRVLQTTSGRVPVDTLREAVWMALWSTQMPHTDQLLGGNGYPLPDTIEPMGSEGVAAALMGARLASGQTRLDWIYVRDGLPSHSGELRWPEDDDNGARDHAVRLLQIAEAAMFVGCAPERAPKKLTPIDSDRGSLSDTQLELEQALLSMKPPRCRGR
jgi:hypothetical protein